jgi:hypothetical protein
MMKTRTRIVIAGIGVGLAAPFLKKAIRPLGSYIVGGGIIAYEVACELVELTGDVLALSAKLITKPSGESSPEEKKQHSSR